MSDQELKSSDSVQVALAQILLMLQEAKAEAAANRAEAAAQRAQDKAGAAAKA